MFTCAHGHFGLCLLSLHPTRKAEDQARHALCGRTDRGQDKQDQDGEKFSLLALVGIGLRHGVRQSHFKFVAAQRHLAVVADKGIEAVEDQVVRQVELGGTCFLPGMDAAVLDTAGAPAKKGQVGNSSQNARVKRARGMWLHISHFFRKNETTHQLTLQPPPLLLSVRHSIFILLYLFI